MSGWSHHKVLDMFRCDGCDVFRGYEEVKRSTVISKSWKRDPQHFPSCQVWASFELSIHLLWHRPENICMCNHSSTPPGLCWKPSFRNQLEKRRRCGCSNWGFGVCSWGLTTKSNVQCKISYFTWIFIDWWIKHWCLYLKMLATCN